MGATDRTITLAAFINWEAPDGDVRLVDGGFIYYDSEKYEDRDAVFGTLAEFEPVEAGFGDAAEGGAITLAPAPEATLSDWWRGDLDGTRIRLFLGEVGSDGKTVSSATLLADWLVDVPERQQGAGGKDELRLELMGRHERLFLTREGNVCSDRFHQSVYSGEKGFENCTDTLLNVAWGTEGPTRSSYGGAGVETPGPAPFVPRRAGPGIPRI